MERVAIENLDAEAFAGLVGSEFSLRGAGGAAAAELVELNRYPAVPGAEAFALVFRVAAEHAPGQGIYELEHPALGVFELFLVPLGATPEGVRLEAVFNRVAGA
jgi:hypothetical protein